MYERDDEIDCYYLMSTVKMILLPKHELIRKYSAYLIAETTNNMNLLILWVVCLLASANFSIGGTDSVTILFMLMVSSKQKQNVVKHLEAC